MAIVRDQICARSSVFVYILDVQILILIMMITYFTVSNDCKTNSKSFYFHILVFILLNCNAGLCKLGPGSFADTLPPLLILMLADTY